MRQLLLVALLSVVLSPFAAAQMFEGFETGTWPWAPWVSVSGGGTKSSAVAHSGSFSMLNPDWYYRTTPQVGGVAGQKVSCWVYPTASGRTYMGFAASSGGCYSLVLAPNTGNMIIQQNSGWGYSDLTSVAYSWTYNKWYKLEVEWTAANSIIGRLIDTNGTTVLATLNYTAASTLSGGVAMRAFGSHYLDDWSVEIGLTITTASPLPAAIIGNAYNVSISAANGVTPYTWNTNITGLPPGITASQSGNNLVLSGTPTTTGTYNFTAAVSDSDSPPDNDSKAYSVTVFNQPTAAPLVDNFSAGTTGWGLGTGWAVGTCVAYGSGNTAEPGQDATQDGANRILGHMIGALYPNNMAQTWATSPPVNCSALTNVRLSFKRWLGLAANDDARIQITNNGTVWHDVWVRPAGTTINSPAAWELHHYDITQWAAGNGFVQVRFGIGPTDATVQHVGWCIDDFRIEEPGPDLLVYEGGVTGTQITDNEAVGGLRDFGVVPTSTTSQTLQIAFVNNGVTTLTGFGWSKSGANPADFVITVSPPSSLAPGATGIMEVQFYATTAGVKTCTIHIPHNGQGSGTSPFDINVRGEAVVPIPDLQVRIGSATGPQVAHDDPAAPGGLRDFGTQDINAGATAPITIFLVNAGTGAMNVNTPDMGGTWWNQYQVSTTGMLSTLSPGQSTSFTVAFDPASVGVKDAYVRVTHSDGSKASPYHIHVTGEGIDTSIPTVGVYEGAGGGTGLAHDAAAANGRDFGDQNINAGPTPPLTITISNIGGQTLTLTTPVLGGQHPGEFALNTNGFQTSLTGGQSTSFEVTFDPNTVGQKHATITFAHNDASVTSPFIINVTGNGVITAPSIAVRQGSTTGPIVTNPQPATGVFDFGTRDISAGPSAPVSIHVSNSGTADLIVGTPVFASATVHFVLGTAGFAGTIVPGDSRSFTIAFDPDAVGTHNAAVQFTHNDGSVGTPFVINVTGEGVVPAPRVEVREGSVTGAVVASGQAAALGGGRDLGSIDIAAGATAPVTLVIINTGTLDLTLGSPAIAGVNAADFILNTTGFASTLTPGSSTSFEVMFDPTLGGMKDANIEFTHNDPAGPTPFVVPVRGTAVDPAGVQITTTAIPPATSGQPYPPFALQAAQGTQPYAWTVYSGNLPAGLNLSSTGQISGTPTGFGSSSNVTIRVADATGTTHERAFNIVVASSLFSTGSGGKGGGCAIGAPVGGMVVLLGLAAVALRRRRR